MLTTTHDHLEVTPLADQVTRASSSTFARYGVSTLDVLLCFAVLIVMCAYTPFFHTWFWTPRMAVVLAVLLPGTIALGSLAARRDRAAQLGAAFLLWALLSAAFSDNWWLSLRGTIAQSTFVVSFAAALGVWALAQSMSIAGRRLMLWTVLVGVTVNAGVGALQVLLQLEGGNLGLSGGRAVGLTPNPIELAAFMLVGIFVCLRLWIGASPAQTTALAAGLLSFGVVLAFTSTRVALMAFGIVVVGAFVQRRSSRQLLGSSIVALGVVAGVVIARVIGNQSDALARAGASTGRRADMWTAGWRAFLDRPLIGWGAGRFRSAIQGELTFPYVAAKQDSQAIPDGHNIFVNMAVDFGLVGLVLFVLFGWFVARRVSGVYALALAAVPIVWMLQPIAQTTVLVYMVMLGIAVSVPRQADEAALDADRSRVKPWMMATATVIGLGAASWLMVAEYRLAQASMELDGDGFAAAEAMYFGDPIVADVGARIWMGRSLFDPTAESRVVAQMERATDIEPTRAYFQARLAFELARSGDHDGAVEHARAALELQPTSSLAWATLMEVAEQTDDERLRTEAAGPLCLLGLGECA